MAFYIGVDIGGTKIHSALVNSSGKILKSSLVETGASHGKKHVIEMISKSISNVFSDKASGIGIGCPGPLDIDSGIIHKTTNLPLQNVNLKSIVEKKFRVRVVLNNDANCFVLGEAIYGAGIAKRTVAGITMGTGIGGGIVIDKMIHSGRGNAGEFGHMVICMNGKSGRCKHPGCLESYIGKSAISDLGKEFGWYNPYQIFMAAKSGNKAALRIWDQIGHYLGIGIANIANSLDPDIIVIGGNVSGAWEFFEKSMKEVAAERSMVGKVKIVKSRLAGDAAVLGASYLARGR